LEGFEVKEKWEAKEVTTPKKIKIGVLMVMMKIVAANPRSGVPV
jgi:hypothetical protein